MAGPGTPAAADWRVTLKRRLAVVAAPTAFWVVGIGFVKESRRFYPNRELGAHLLGWVGIDNKGLSGVESTFDRQIRGMAGTILVQTDARHHAFSRFERPPTSGSTIELTIDEYLQ